MRNLNFLKLFYGLMLVMVSTAFVSCVDDNDDTEAPYLEVSPTTLIFGLDGQPANGSQASFDISTNRSWKATVKDDKLYQNMKVKVLLLFRLAFRKTLMMKPALLLRFQIKWVC